MTPAPPDPEPASAPSPALDLDLDLDLDELATAIEDFNTYFIRLPSVRKLSFSTLSVLHTLQRRGPMRLTALTATEQLKQPALTSLVAKLEQDGLVSRRPDPRDGRAVLLELTEEGLGIVRSRHADRVARLSRLVDHLNDEERAALAGSARVLGRLTEIAASLDD
ncbi:MarR family transcriptional regulator [Nonomuraea sp. NPDC048882]|uniref:MarR family winged helix-turn-helix transcriptional regulator n=1 Tax=Nonomuraea sp. NPDC048882 TaxID=3154347 RepID=UPI0033F572EB